MTPAPRNSYYVCPPGGLVRRWEAPFSPDGLPPDCRYFGRVLRQVESMTANAGLRFVVTWSVDRLPMYGDDVVVVLLGDEWCRWPRYAHRVGAVFKGYGVRPALPVESLKRLDRLSLVLVVQFVKVVLVGLPSRYWQLRWLLTPERRRAQVRVLPPGTFQSLEVPLPPWRDRPVDVVFVGSLQHDDSRSRGLRSLLGDAKLRSRRDLCSALEEVARRLPEVRLDLTVTGSFGESTSADASDNTTRMARAKIAVAPRGTSSETFRLLEGLKSGCVVIAEPLPRHWFYSQPAWLTVRRWDELPALVEFLLGGGSGTDGGDSLHQAALSHWQDVFSEAAVGAYIARSLRGAPGMIRRFV